MKYINSLFKRFTFKLVNYDLPHYFQNFSHIFPDGVNHNSLRKPSRQIPKIVHEFPKHSLLYKLMILLLDQLTANSKNSASFLSSRPYRAPPPPSRTAEGGFICFVWVCSVPLKNVFQGKPVLFRVIQVKRQKNVLFQHIHSTPILMNYTF